MGKNNNKDSNRNIRKDPNKFNTSGTRYVGKLAGAIKEANERNYNKSKAGRLENAAKESLGGDRKIQTPTTIEARSALLENNRNTLLGKAKDNTLNSGGLNNLAKANRQLGFNETTGMGIKESFQYQVTRPEMKRDLKKLSNTYRKLPTITNLLLNALGGTDEKLSK